MIRIICILLISTNYTFSEESLLNQEHKVYDRGGLSKVHRITKNELAISALLKEVLSLKKEVMEIKKQLSDSAPKLESK